MKAHVIIQARMGSTRYPGKVLAPLGGKPIVSRVLERVQQANPSIITVAMTDKTFDDPLSSYVKDCGFSVHRGSCDDVLARYCGAARMVLHEIPIVRITCDCPLIDPATIVRLVTEFYEREVPYIGRSNSPDGDDCEVFSRDLLREAFDCATDKYDREHVTPYMRRKIGAVTMEATTPTAGVKYSIDSLDDLHTCEQLLKMAGEGASWQDYTNAYLEMYP